MRNSTLKKSLSGYLFVLPQFLVFAVFTIYLIFEGFRISLYQTDAVRYSFVGLKNYVDLFADPVFLRSVWNTLFLTAVVTVVSLFIGLTVSIGVFDKSGAYISFIRTCY